MTGRRRSGAIARRLAGASPALFRLARGAWHLARDVLPPSAGGPREHLRYHDEVVRLARAWAPGGGRALDVGAGRTSLLQRLDWFAERVALDRQWIPRQRGVVRVRAPFLDYDPVRPFDLVLCLQVLEHLEAPEPFARRLLRTGRTVIVSVPYGWERGVNPGHVQDPVDEGKLAAWMGREPREARVVQNGRQRLVAAYEGTAG